MVRRSRFSPWVVVLVACSGCGGHQQQAPKSRQPKTPGTSVVEIESAGDTGTAPARRSLSGLADSPVTPLVDEAWSVAWRRDAYPAPLAAVLRARAWIDESTTSLEFAWLLTPSGARLIRWEPLQGPEQPGDAAESTVPTIQPLLQQVVDGYREGSLAAWQPALSPEDPLAQRWPGVLRELLAQPVESWNESVSPMPRRLRLLEGVKVSFLIESSEGLLSRLDVSGPEYGWEAPFEIGEPETLAASARWRLEAPRWSSALGALLSWTVQLIDAARDGRALPAGYLPFERRDPLQPLFVHQPELHGTLPVVLSGLEFRYAPPGQDTLRLSVLVMNGRPKVLEARRVSGRPSITTRVPEVRAALDAVVHELAQGNLQDLQFTPSELSELKELFGQPPSAPTPNLPGYHELKQIRDWLRASKGEGEWVLDEVGHLVRSSDETLFGFEVETTKQDELVWETTPLFKIKKIRRPEP